MALVCLGAKATLLADFETQSVILKLFTLGVTIAVAAGVYFGANLLLKNEEMHGFTTVLKRKLGIGTKS
jgi:hypothetical protein